MRACRARQSLCAPAPAVPTIPPLPPADASAAPPRAGGPGRALLLAWTGFWLLMLLIEQRDHVRRGGSGLALPLLWAGSSCLVASLLLARQWRRVQHADALIEQPARWFARALATLPGAALAFVSAVYALRHAAFALAGARYQHEPWPQVYLFESLKFALFFMLFAAVVFALRQHAALADARLRAAQQQALAREAQLAQLAAQVAPHFLFNALNTIAETVYQSPELADQLLTRLAALLRASSDLAQRPDTTLADELRLAEDYAAIACQRFGDRLRLQFDIDPTALDCRLPTLLLQPLLENALRHGVEPRSAPTRVVVRARRSGRRLTLQVSDSAGRLPPQPREGVGTGNLRRRLAARWGDQALLRLQRGADGGTLAEVELPCDC